MITLLLLWYTLSSLFHNTIELNTFKHTWLLCGTLIIAQSTNSKYIIHCVNYMQHKMTVYSRSSLKGLTELRNLWTKDKEVWSQQVHHSTLLPLKNKKVCITSKKCGPKSDHYRGSTVILHPVFESIATCV